CPQVMGLFLPRHSATASCLVSYHRRPVGARAGSRIVARLVVLPVLFPRFAVFVHEAIQIPAEKPAEQARRQHHGGQQQFFHKNRPLSVYRWKQRLMERYSPRTSRCPSAGSTVSEEIFTSMVPLRLMPSRLMPYFLRMSMSPTVCPAQDSSAGTSMMALLASSST